MAKSNKKNKNKHEKKLGRSQMEAIAKYQKEQKNNKKDIKEEGKTNIQYQKISKKTIVEDEAFLKMKSNIKIYKDLHYTAIAPYNFITFPKKVVTRYNSIEELPKFNKFYNNLNTGFIEYEFTNETPIFIGNEKKDNEIVTFFKNADNDFTVPGSTIKGLVRSNSEILGFGYPEFIEDARFLYRKVASKGLVRKEYNRIISTSKTKGIDSVVKAGYIFKENENYYLIPAKEKKGKSFYSISEKNLRTKLISDSGNIKFMYNEDLKTYKIKNFSDWKHFCKYNKNKEYSPYTCDITFDKTNDNKITKISIKNELNNKGKLINSNYMNLKSKHYIINEMDNIKLKIDSQIIIDYKNDCERNKQRSPKEFYELPKEDGIENKKVFFYKLENNKVAYLGRCPYLRIFYKKSVRDCIKIKSIGQKIDYPNAMYGFTRTINDKKQNYKSRISFTDAKCYKPNIIGDVKKLILASPKATCFPLYLKQQNVIDANDVITYNRQFEAELRGNKFYWLKDIDIKKFDTCENDDVATKIKDVIDKNSKFIGRVYFENLYDDELGLLLLSIKFNNECKENIGMGKPYGMGRVVFNDITLFLEQNKFTNFNSDYIQSGLTKYKKTFIDAMNTYIKNIGYKENYLSTDIVKNYYSSKTEIMPENKACYMDLGSFKEDNILPMI